MQSSLSLLSSSYEDERDVRFAQMLQRQITQVVQQWDADPVLLAECRSHVPLEELQKDDGLYSEVRDLQLASSSTRFVQRLARWFQQHKMTWINSPACVQCSSTEHMKSQSDKIRGPETDEEKQGDASRVEVHVCSQCNVTTPFPRYNSVRKLLQTCSGRCGEYANLFGLVCRSVGLETRYIWDSTDHVWTEVYLLESEDKGAGWIMVDSCEGVIDENSMYEVGWGKQLSYVVAIGNDHVVDVTCKYTRQFHTNDDLKARRRTVTSSEQVSYQIIQQCNAMLQSKMDKKTIAKLKRRMAVEEALLQQFKIMTVWEKQYANGRISGSTAWKVSRLETGTSNTNNDNNNNNNAENHDKNSSSRMFVESYYARNKDDSQLVIQVNPKHYYRHDAIVVNGVACAMGSSNGEDEDDSSVVSVVVLDEVFLGCILQSASFATAQDLVSFVSKLPQYRIVILHGKVKPQQDDDSITTTTTASLTQQLGGLDPKLLYTDGILYVGQVLAHPQWTVCRSWTEGKPIQLETTKTTTSRKDDWKLKTIKGARPKCVVGRVPESIMPLQTQLLAGYEQKRLAFLKFLQQPQQPQPQQNYYGYTTKRGCPIYLLQASAYPFIQSTAHPQDDDQSDKWNSFLVLPTPLVDPDDQGIVEDSTNKPKSSTPMFQVPLEESFFIQHVGSTLLQKSSSGMVQSVPTVDALRNTRLVGLYFSAHWCGPCRSFTPMLAEMYEILKEEFPSHGLEIIFVSSDRDANSFQRYYSSMPWLSIPFETLAVFKQQLSMKYGVRGIPSLVILDSMSGQIVVPANQARQEVGQACQRGGEQGIVSMFQNSWLPRIPEASRELAEMLAISCIETSQKRTNSTVREEEKVNPYLLREESAERTQRINTLVKQLMEDGMDREEALEAAQAVEDVSSEPEPLEPGPFTDLLQLVTDNNDKGNNKMDDAKFIAQQMMTTNASSSGNDENSSSSSSNSLSIVLATALKYVDNARKAPWTTKFRSFNLSFKVADRVTRVEYGIPLLQSLGFEIHGTYDDFVAFIPFACDLDKMHDKIEALMKEVQ